MILENWRHAANSLLLIDLDSANLDSRSIARSIDYQDQPLTIV